MIRPTAEQITNTAVGLGLELTADELTALPEFIQRQTDGFSVLWDVDTDGVRPLFDVDDCGADGR